MTERGTAGGPRRLAASLLVDAGASLGEAPLWDAVDGSLVWVDILAGIVHVMSPSGETRASFTLGHTVGSAMPADGGGWLLADAMGYGLLSREGHRTALLDLLADRPELRFNDAKCDPLGRAWAGTIESAMAPGTGTLYRLDPGPVATPVLRGLTVSNGIGWSPDGHTMWFADSADRTIRGFDYGLEDGRLGVPSRGIRQGRRPVRRRRGVRVGGPVVGLGRAPVRAGWPPRHDCRRPGQPGHKLCIRGPGSSHTVHHDRPGGADG
jgi:sugar lactone lactonase YvrE